MARVTEISVEDATTDQEALLQAELAAGEIYNTSRIWAYRPAGLRGLKALAGGLEEERILPAGIVHLARLRVAQINGCPF
jgi:alkylhydroperoxidase family enzyme